jgi:integration host factor subunit beta
MVKSELISRLAARQDTLSLGDMELSVNYIIDRMGQALSDGDRIEIRGFGSFSLHYRPPRRAHNPKTGERVFTQAKHTPHFKPGKDLRERVNESGSRLRAEGQILRGEDNSESND